MTDNLSQTPILAAVVAAVVLVVRWLDGKHRRELARHKRAAAEELRRLEEQYRERLAEKDRRIRSLDREVRQLRSKRRPTTLSSASAGTACSCSGPC